MASEELDLVIIGGGISGLCALRTILTLENNSTLSIALLENQPSIGGVWAEERLYTGLKTNHVLGSYEFSDFPMRKNIGADVKPTEHIPGDVVHNYLEAYVDEFGLRKYIRLGHKVESVVERRTGKKISSWLLDVKDLSTLVKSSIQAKKLIIATGQTSQPYFPDQLFTNQEQFKKPIFHCVDLHKHEAGLLEPTTDQEEKHKKITVFGSAKSAFDAAYTIAKTYNTPVDMIIRASGHGPIWMCPALVTPFKVFLEKLMTVRLLTWFSPCVWGNADGYAGIRSFLHSTWLGRKIVDVFWSVIGNDVKTLNKYDLHPETAKLKPWVGPLWVASGLSILNYKQNFFDLVREGKVMVHIADIKTLSDSAVHLSTGDVLDSDGIVCCTGWRTTPTIKIPPDTQKELGFSTAEDPLPLSLIQKADEHILGQLPCLKIQPIFNSNYRAMIEENPSHAGDATHPTRLYRFLIPCTPHLSSSHSIAFLGMTTTASTMVITQAQALWIAAYFYHPTFLSLPLEMEGGLEWSTALHTQYCKWRYGVGGHGNRRPDFVFDALPYIDLLLKDLGMKAKRKETRLKEWMEPYGVEDYRGLVEEFGELLKKKD